MALIPAIIGAGASILGGVLSDRSNRKVAESTNEQAREISEQQIALQREFAQSGIRWRVEDARAAGLHPLFALGGNAASYSPQAMQLMTPDQSGLGRGLAEAGQSVSRSIQAQQTQAQRAITQASLAHLVAQTGKEDAMAAYYASEAARNRQSANVSGSLPEGTVDVGPLIKNVPDEVIRHDPRDPSKTAGTHPGMTRYTLPGGITLHAPSENMKESVEDIPLIAWPFIIRESEKADPHFWRKVDNFLFSGRAQAFGRQTAREVNALKRIFRAFRPKGIPHQR